MPHYPVWKGFKWTRMSLPSASTNAQDNPFDHFTPLQDNPSHTPWAWWPQQISHTYLLPVLLASNKLPLLTIFHQSLLQIIIWVFHSILTTFQPTIHSLSTSHPSTLNTSTSLSISCLSTQPLHKTHSSSHIPSYQFPLSTHPSVPSQILTGNHCCEYHESLLEKVLNNQSMMESLMESLVIANQQLLSRQNDLLQQLISFQTTAHNNQQSLLCQQLDLLHECSSPIPTQWCQNTSSQTTMTVSPSIHQTQTTHLGRTTMSPSTPLPPFFILSKTRNSKSKNSKVSGHRNHTTANCSSRALSQN